VKLPAGVQGALAVGDPRAQILRAAAEAPTDCIVMGTHGRRGFERFVLGSVTEHVLRKAACPVLAVPPLPDERRPAGIFPSVLCAIDFAAASLHALDLARSLVAPRGRLVLIHSIQWPFRLGPSPKPREMEPLRARLEGDAEERLERVTVDQRDSVTIERHVAAGKPHAEILRCARDAGAALIVAGLHSHAVNDIALLGSTTRRVLHDAPCPVLTTR
jgi:nucleotide-binding universal stress UspA family protein